MFQEVKMFKVIDKRDNDIREIYAVSNDDYDPKFLYFDSTTKQWKWCFASWFEPYFEHRFIIEDKPYHLNSDKIRGKDSRYDNRKNNLRYATHSQNNQNKNYQKNNTSGVRGVDYFKPADKWRARITKEGITYDLGYFDNIENAIKVRREAEDKYFKEWSYINSINMEVN